jgi:PPOX class probable F420-dependent enzyme
MRAARRTRGQLTWDWVDRRLLAMREIWVATASPGGRPDAVPVWFWWDGGQLYFSTKATSRKARNLARNPHLVVHNGDGADPIIIEGEAERVEGAAELERVDHAYAGKYVAPESGDRATIFVDGDVVFRVKPRRVLAWEYATCSYRTDWEFE